MRGEKNGVTFWYYFPFSDSSSNLSLQHGIAVLDFGWSRGASPRRRGRGWKVTCHQASEVGQTACPRLPCSPEPRMAAQATNERSAVMLRFWCRSSCFWYRRARVMRAGGWAWPDSATPSGLNAKACFRKVLTTGLWPTKLHL